MRPRAFVTALVIATPLIAAPVARAQDDDQAQRRNAQSREQMRFQGMDVNRDGVITRREWRGSDTSFRAHDWNGDNVLSGDEVRVGAVRTPNNDEDYTPSRRPAFYDWNQAGFNRIDTNRDGRITLGEWRYDVESFRRADWIDVSRGLRTFGVPRPFIASLFSAWPSAGFHRRLVELTLDRLWRHPLSPLPMVRL